MTRIAARKKNGDNQRRLRIIAITVGLAFVITGSGVFVYKYLNFSLFKRSKVLVQNFFLGTHRAEEKSPAVKTQQLVQANAEFTEPIHFEFYSLLPQAQIKNPQTLTKQANKIIVAKDPVKVANNATKPGFKPELLEKEFAKNLALQRYILQFGIFSNEGAAESYRRRLVRSGINAAVVKDNHGPRSNFRLQQGPYGDIAEVRMLQKQFKQRGIKSVVRKMA